MKSLVMMLPAVPSSNFSSSSTDLSIRLFHGPDEALLLFFGQVGQDVRRLVGFHLLEDV